ncbi:hypothetical protein IFM89_012406, partial [Coptis chinensis]
MALGLLYSPLSAFPTSKLSKKRISLNSQYKTCRSLLQNSRSQFLAPASLNLTVRISKEIEHIIVGLCFYCFYGGLCSEVLVLDCDGYANLICSPTKPEVAALSPKLQFLLWVWLKKPPCLMTYEMGVNSNGYSILYILSYGIVRNALLGGGSHCKSYSMFSLLSREQKDANVVQ